MRDRASKGQNMMEIVLTMGIVMVMSLTSIELGRVWQAYAGARLAALDGAATAAMYKDTVIGVTQIDRRLGLANLNGTARQVVQNGDFYEASVTVAYEPVFGGISIPAPGRTLTVIPGAFDIQYNATRSLASI